MGARKSLTKAEEMGAPHPPADEAARARAYLDLWERQLVHLALNQPPPAGDRARA